MTSPAPATCGTTTGDLVWLSGPSALDNSSIPIHRQLWTSQIALPATSSEDPGPFLVTGSGHGTFLGQVRGHPRINPGDLPGYQTLLAHLPDQKLDLAVLCYEEAL